MPLNVFEALCAVVVALSLTVMARARGAWRPLLTTYAALALAGFVGEESCIVLYRFYAYAPGWHLRAHHVPALVPLIWPLVILSAREVVASLWPANSLRTAVMVGLAVTVDASLMEVIAVRAGLWSWAEGGHLNVPVIGILGWGFFAFGASLALDRRGAPWTVLVVGPLVAHALIVASWWAALRWIARGALTPGSWVIVGGASALATAASLAARRAGRTLPWTVSGPRVVAASLFFALLIFTAPTELAMWGHTAAVALPYLAATRYRR